MFKGEEYIGDAVYCSFDGWQYRLRCAAPPSVIYLEPAVFQAFIRYANRIRKQQEEMMTMSDDTQENQSAPEYDNSVHVPYLKIIAEGGDLGVGKDEFGEKAQAYYDSLEDPATDFPGGSKLRQTLYISKLARGDGSMIVLTDAGRSLIEG